MKVEELMVYDYITVAHTHSQPTIEQVYGLNKNSVIVKTKEGLIYLFEYSRISPVPLSEEILERLGFTKHSTENTNLYLAKGCKKGVQNDFWYEITIQDYAEDGFYIDVYSSETRPNTLKEISSFIKNVHELQHILKLIGIEKEVKI